MASDEDFEEFVAGALPRLLRFAHLLTGSRTDAEDLVQTALGRSWRAWRAGRIEDPQAFVRKVMINRHTSWRQRQGKETVLASMPEAVTTADDTGRIHNRDAMCRALLMLPPRQRTVLVLRYYEDLSELEIADLMGIARGTVKSQAARALRHLAVILTAAEPASDRDERSRR